MPGLRVNSRRVLFDLGLLATGTRQRGLGRYVSELARGLVAIQKEWAELEIVFLERLGWDGHVALSHELEPAIARLTRGAPAARYAWAYPLRLHGGSAARQAGADLFHLPTPGATPLRLGTIPSLVTCHDLIPYRYPEHYAGVEDGFRWGRRALDRRRYRSAEHVIAVSRATAADLQQQLGLAPGRISVVLSGIDAARWTAPEARRDSAQLARLGLTGRRFISYVGDADWRKNGAGMLRALAELRRRDSALELVWLGTPSKLAYDRARRAEAERCGVAPACHFLGYVSDAELGAVYRSSLATLLVSRAEGFGYPVLEAMAAGCPVIASNTSSLPEVADDAALLVDPENPSAIAAAVALLARDPARREQLIRRGRARAAELSLLAQARATLAVYRALLNRCAPPT
jgi:glycosyltransferase involved in cell wall biosynthesis